MMAFRDFEQEGTQQASAVWDSGQNSDQNTASAANPSPMNLASLYQPPFALMYKGPFEKVLSNSDNLAAIYSFFTNIT
jgi:hypothetical protein